MTDEVRHSEGADPPEIALCLFTNVYGRPGCEALVNRMYMPRGYCRNHDPDRPPRPRKGDKK